MVEPITATTLAVLASVLSIAASVKSLMRMQKIDNTDAIEAYRKDATEAERRLIDENQTKILEITVISENLLKQLADEAGACEQRHVAARKNATSQIDKEIADIGAAQCMCNVLRAIKRYNKMKLPLSFEDWWDSYGCTN